MVSLPVGRFKSVAVAAVLVAMSGHAFADVSNEFDYLNGARTLQIRFDQSAINFAVASNDPNVTNIAESYARGLATWNDAFMRNNIGWSFTTAAAPGRPSILVRMGEAFNANDGQGNVDPNGVPRFQRPPSRGARMDGDTPTGQPPAPGGGGGLQPSNALAIFFPGAPVANPQNLPLISAAQIVVNPLADWGLLSGFGIQNERFDPIIVALHELGHAIRLEHDANTAAGDTVSQMIPDGPVMRPLFDPAVHQTNPFTDPMTGNILYDRYPHARDIMFAGNSVALIPAPSAAATLGLLGLAALRRRR